MPKKLTKRQSKSTSMMRTKVDRYEPEQQHHLISISPSSTEQKQTLHPYSNSRLTNLNMCPTWGVVSAQKRYPTSARSMALEAGALMHEVFAALRIWQLHRRQRLPQHAEAVSRRLFGVAKSEPSYFNQASLSQTDITNRWAKCWRASASQKEDRESMMILAYEILHSSGWEDSFDDQTRTINHMEQASIVYIDEILSHMENFPIFVHDSTEPQSVVGIENVFDVVLTYDDSKQYRFIGTLDGLTYDKAKERYTLEDNKTASRLDDGWKASFTLSHQVSGYLACAASVYGIDIYHSRILGLKIKPYGRGEDVWPIYPSRTAENFQRWAFWFRHTADMYELYKDHYEYAPRYTHSCNRYFRPCSFIPFCGDTL